MTMRQDDMPSPGFIPNSPRLCQEVAKAINHVEVQRDLQGAAGSSGEDLAAFFEKLLAYMKAKDLVPAPKKGK
jgi:hypothetical protein